VDDTRYACPLSTPLFALHAWCHSAQPSCQRLFWFLLRTASPPLPSRF
jgi:hypothetical protein